MAATPSGSARVTPRVMPIVAPRPTPIAAARAIGVPGPWRPTTWSAATVAEPPTRSLAGALLGYLLVVALVITLAPFDFRVPAELRVRTDVWTVLDVVANVLLFAPVGFLAAQLGARTPVTPLRIPAPALWAIAVGVGASVVIEAAQLFVPDRFSSPWDVLANGVGTGLGVAAYEWVRRRLDPSRVVGQLGLELPLMGLVYLLVPLGWVDALVLAAHPGRWPLPLCLGLFGGSVLAAVQRRHFGPAGLLSAPAIGLVAAAWSVVCSLPALTTRPQLVALVASVVAAFTWYRAAEPAPAPGPSVERRFEILALLRAAPFFGAYLLLLALTAPDADADLRRPVILNLVETLGAFTLLGYMTAEALGRLELPFARSLPWVLLSAAVAALSLAAARSAGAPSLAAWGGVVVALAAAAYGGWLYTTQRRHVRTLARG